ncbi:MAG: 2-oxoacid:acceptor oxidoreductase subunit alpha [Halanaerobiales bacterium]
MDFTIVIGGEAGQGLQTVDYILGKTLFRMGYNVYTSKNIMSRIRGGHNFITTRIGTEPVKAITEDIDILIALNEETVEIHKDRVVDGGLIFYDGDKDVSGKKLINLNAGEIAKEINPKGVNTVFIGAVLKAMSLDTDAAEKVVGEYFEDDGIVEDNIELLSEGFNSIDSMLELEESSGPGDQIYLDGNNALAMGAAAAGVQFYAAYPMSPSTSIMNYLAGKQEELGLVVEQAEDEIAAINMALGGSYSGIRSMTGTSGGGLALMNETIGLAGIVEIPVVIADVQRPGPATGLPTRTGQGDLLFAINSAQDDFPLIVLGPRNHEDAFRQAFRAFNLADKYQLPVILLSNQYLADSAKNVEAFDFDSLAIDYGLISDDEAKNIDDYKRYKFTDSGISPRAYPGQIPGEVLVIDSDEHDEYGHIIEDAETRNVMVEKRARKIEKYVEEDLEEPVYQGEEDVEFVLLGWGSTYGALDEARKMLEDEGISVGLLSFSDLWPLPVKKLNEMAEKGVKFVDVESNSTAQFARLIRSETGIKTASNILKYDGRPFTGIEIARRFKEEVMD